MDGGAKALSPCVHCGQQLGCVDQDSAEGCDVILEWGRVTHGVPEGGGVQALHASARGLVQGHHGEGSPEAARRESAARQ
eukprot:12674810-Alexandrium_andersonii.AAC.1